MYSYLSWVIKKIEANVNMCKVNITWVIDILFVLLFCIFQILKIRIYSVTIFLLCCNNSYIIDWVLLVC